MAIHTVDTDRLRGSYMPMRARLVARRKVEERRLTEAREAIRRIDREIMALDRARMRRDRQSVNAANTASGRP